MAWNKLIRRRAANSYLWKEVPFPGLERVKWKNFRFIDVEIGAFLFRKKSFAKTCKTKQIENSDTNDRKKLFQLFHGKG